MTCSQLVMSTVSVALVRHAERACYCHSMQAGHLPEDEVARMRLSTVSIVGHYRPASERPATVISGCCR